MILGSPKKAQLDLPFDQYQRYRIVAEALEILREGNTSPLRILDVGGGEGIALHFFPDDDLEILDQTVVEGVPNFVEGDATAMPYEDDAFDYVTSVDVYEHIPPEARRKYLSELRRVAGKGILLAGPFESEAVRAAERLVNELHRAVHLQGNVWLEEHKENSLPGLPQTREFFEEHQDTITVVPNGYLPHWIAMLSMVFYGVKLGDELKELFDRFNTFYNEFMYRYDNSEPCYRYLLVALKEDREVSFEQLTPPVEHQNTAMSSALFSTFSAALPMVPQLKNFESQLDVLRRQSVQKDGRLTQKDIQIRDLSMRLARQMTEENDTVALRREIASLRVQRNQLQNQLNAMKNSRAWKAMEKQRQLRVFIGNRLKRNR